MTGKQDDKIFQYLTVRIAKVHAALCHEPEVVPIYAALEELDRMEEILDEAVEPLPIPYRLLIAELADEIATSATQRLKKKAERIRDKAEGMGD